MMREASPVSAAGPEDELGNHCADQRQPAADPQAGEEKGSAVGMRR